MSLGARVLAAWVVLGMQGCPGVDFEFDDDDTAGDDDTVSGDDDDTTAGDDDVGDDDVGDDDAGPVDADGDGWSEDEDCDDHDSSVHPGASEVCGNDVDDDCDGVIDPDCVIDSFVQAGNRMVDILWVVDNSNSMYEEQGLLAAAGGAFFERLDDADMDYHVSVVTTETNAFQGPQPIMTPTTSDVALAFEAAVSVGVGGSGFEQGLKYGSEAITPPLASPGGPNDGFLRAGAGLRMIFVSDEEDQSPEIVASYVTLLYSLKETMGHVVLGGITGQITGCGNAESTVRYEEAIALTAGVSESICDADWTTSVQNLASRSIHYSDTFVLSAQPDPATIGVHVDGVAVLTGWSYEITLNAVVFDTASAPDNGDVVEIHYRL